MSKTKLDLKAKSDLNLVKFGRDHRDALLNNPNFPDPRPSAEVFDADLQAFSDKLDAVSAAEMVLQVLRLEKEQLRKTYENNFMDRASYVDIQSKGSEALILNAGFQVHSGRTMITSIEAPFGLVATMGVNDGEIQIVFQKVPRSKSYITEVREHSEVEAPGAWRDPKVSTRAGVRFSGLVSGKKYAFRIKALGPNELESAWSGK